MLTVIYASNELMQRQQLWDKLASIGSQITTEWLVYGDFNNVLYSEDRIGGSVTQAETQGFKELLDRLQFTPLKST